MLRDCRPFKVERHFAFEQPATSTNDSNSNIWPNNEDNAIDMNWQ